MENLYRRILLCLRQTGLRLNFE